LWLIYLDERGSWEFRYIPSATSEVVARPIAVGAFMLARRMQIERAKANGMEGFDINDADDMTSHL
jgi:hypothetical protein